MMKRFFLCITMTLLLQIYVHGIPTFKGSDLMMDNVLVKRVGGGGQNDYRPQLNPEPREGATRLDHVQAMFSQLKPYSGQYNPAPSVGIPSTSNHQPVYSRTSPPHSPSASPPAPPRRRYPSPPRSERVKYHDHQLPPKHHQAPPRTQIMEDHLIQRTSRYDRPPGYHRTSSPPLKRNSPPIGAQLAGTAAVGAGLGALGYEPVGIINHHGHYQTAYQAEGSFTDSLVGKCIESLCKGIDDCCK